MTRRNRRSETGATLVVSLIMLTLITLMIIAALAIGSANFKTVTNMQFRDGAVDAANKAIDQVRHDARRPRPSADVPETPARDDVSDLDRPRLRAALAALPPKQRGAVVYRYLADLSYEEVAEHCQCPVGTVKSRVSRARLDLKRMLDEQSMAQPRRNVPPVADANLTESLGDSTEIKLRPGRRAAVVEERRLVN